MIFNELTIKANEHELTMKAKEKHEQVYKAVINAKKQEHIDIIMENLPFSSIPELLAITMREKLMELLSFANFEKGRKGITNQTEAKYIL